MVDIYAQAEAILRKIHDGFAKSETSELKVKIENGKVKVFASKIKEIK